MYHGYGNLDKAINLLNKDDREDFRTFVNTNIQFNNIYLVYNLFVKLKVLYEFSKIRSVH